MRYAQEVLEKHKPTIKIQKQQKLDRVEEANKSLSFFETHKKGVQYLRIVNESARKNPKENKPPTEPQGTKYRNYLP